MNKTTVKEGELARRKASSIRDFQSSHCLLSAEALGHLWHMDPEEISAQSVQSFLRYTRSKIPSGYNRVL
jgi:hypothetical protein